MRHVNHRLARTPAELRDHGPDALLIAAVEPVQRLVQNQQVGVLDERPGEQQQALFRRRKAAGKSDP